MATDRTRKCIDCGEEWEFTEKEEKFIRSKVESGEFEEYNEPRRCVPCRRKRRESKKGRRNGR